MVLLTGIHHNFGLRKGSFQYSLINNKSSQSAPYNGAYTFSFSPATAVPFDVSPDLGILILGGLYGASRLCKTIAARKQMSNQEA